MTQAELFEHAAHLPEGFAYKADFLDTAQESSLLESIRGLPLREAQYKQWSAKRRIMSYGGRYDFSQNELLPASPIPTFLFELREQVAAWTRTPAAQFNHAMIAEYRPGTQLGWHRDVPDFESVVGVSLNGACRMRFRPYPPDANHRRASFALELQPRSVYSMRGPARWAWQHAISPTKTLRYSITLRTLAAARGAGV
jgi:alkylated DNA repair dioxygenase AlkB